MHYDPDCDAIGVAYDQPHSETHEVCGLGWVMIDLVDGDSHQASGLEVLGISAWLPLGTRGYHKETDTLTFGDGAENAAAIGTNGDLIAYWRRDSSAASGLTPIAVALKNASKHLAPVIEAMPRTAATRQT